MSRDGAFSCAQHTKNWCVGFSFPPPAYAGIHPTLYLFGFRANALNSHSPSLCLALTFFLTVETFGAFEGLRRPLGASLPGGGLRASASRGFRLRALPTRGLQVWQWVSRFCWGLPSRGLRGPPGPPGGPPGTFGVKMFRVTDN